MATSQDYKLTAVITSQRFPDHTFDVTNTIAELNLYESVHNPYLTGQIAILDDNGLLNTIQFKGTESLTITLRDGDGNQNIDKTFIITEIAETVRLNDNSEMFTLTLVEPHFFYSKANPVSRTYKGKPEAIISSIVTDSLISKKLIKQYVTAPSQSTLRLTLPYMEPLDAVELLRDRMTTSEGFPFVLYSTLHRAGLVMDNLGDILNKPAWNESNPFVYSQAAAGSTDSQLHKLLSIEKFVRPNADDMLTTLMDGAVGSRFSVFDTTYGQTVHATHHDIDETLKPLLDDSAAEQSIFDKSFVIDGNGLNVINSRNIFQVVSSQTYDDAYSFNEEDKDPSLHKTKIQAHAIAAAMDKNLMVVQLPGPLFLAAADRTVGARIQIDIHTSATLDPDSLDASKSGAYMIISMRHIFADGKHMVSASVSKLTEQKRS